MAGKLADFSDEYMGCKVRVETSIGVTVEGVLVEASRYWFKVKSDKGVVYINKAHVVAVTPLGGSRGGGGCRGLSTGSQLRGARLGLEGVVGLPEVLFSVEGGRVVPIALLEVDGFTAVSPAVREFTVYTGLRVEGGVVRAVRWPSVDAAPVGPLALFSYVVESGGRVLHRYRRWFVVVDGVERTIVLRDRRGVIDVRVRAVNMLPLADIDVSMVPEIISRIAGRSLKPSESDPVLALYACWVVLAVNQTLC